MNLKQFFSRAPAPVRASEPGESRVSRLLLPWAEWLTRFPQWSKWDSPKAVAEGFQASPWVYAAITRRYQAIASVPWVVQQRTADGWEPAPDNHPLARLLEEPNPEMSLSELISLTQIHLDLAGNAFWHKLKVGDGAGGRTKYVYPVMPETVKIIPGTLSLIDGYEVGHAQAVRLPASDITHFAYPNPGDLLYGQSPLMAAGKSVDVDNSAAAWQKVSMQNRGVPDGVFEIDDPDLTDDQFAEVRKIIREQYAAGVGNARAPWAVNRAKWRPMSLSPAEVDFIETRHLSMKEICAVYGVPSEMISGMGDSNRASSETVRKTFWLDTILPLLADMEATLNRSLAREYGPTIRIAYDTSVVPALQANRSELVKNARELWSMGVPFNVINQKLELGFDDIEGGDIGYLQAGLIPSDFDFNLVDAGGEANAEEAGRKAYGG